MAKFLRGLSKTFIEVFNHEYDKGEWLRKLVEDKEIFTAIRNDSINFYYLGGSVLELSCANDELIGKVHYKYLLKPSLNKNEDRYIKFTDGKIKNLEKLRHLFLQNYNNIGALKGAIKPHARLAQEKVNVHNIICKNKNVIDVEIAYNKLRLDIVALQGSKDGMEIVFYEVKLFKNHDDLRAKEPRKPKVFSQMDDYSELLMKKSKNLIENYQKVCRNLKSLKGVIDWYPNEYLYIFDQIADDPKCLSISNEPKLIVTGFDKDQRGGSEWKKHHEKLKNKFGERYDAIGESKNVKLQPYPV